LTEQKRLNHELETVIEDKTAEIGTLQRRIQTLEDQIARLQSALK